jgi:hypothetical protein
VTSSVGTGNRSGIESEAGWAETGATASADEDWTWAGATELALKAAQISSAERSVINMESVVIAVNRPLGQALVHAD